MSQKNSRSESPVQKDDSQPTPSTTEPKGPNCMQNMQTKMGCTSENMSKMKSKKEEQKAKMKAQKQALQDDPNNGLEFEDRDIQGLHDDLKVNFADVIAEPDGVHSFSTIWGTSYKSYSVAKFWSYRILTAFLGIPFALFWGLYFAVLAFMNVWCIVPFVKCFTIQMKFVSEIWSKLINTFLDPFFTSIGKVFANIQMTITMLKADEKASQN